jgi:hypothetical protein
MIPINFSITREAVSFIYKQREQEDFVSRELLTRIIGVSLSILQLLDFLIHTVGVVESTFYSIYRGIIENKVIDFALPLKHIKCLKIFAESFFSSSIEGIIFPDNKSFSKIESKQVSSVRGLLLSRHEKYYTENCHIDPLEFVDYVQTLTEKLKPAEKEEMQETIELLNETKSILQDFDRLEYQSAFLDGYLSSLLCKGINHLIKRDSTLMEKIIFKECLSRLLALGLSFTSAIDVIIRVIMATLGLIELFLLDTLVMKGYFYKNDIKKIGQIFIYLLRDTVFSIVGTLSGSLIGIVSPSLACEIAKPSSGFYDNFRFSSKDIYYSILKKVENLREGRSILIPISLPLHYGSGDSSHFVTILVKKDEGDSYTVSVINKGYGSHKAAEVAHPIKKIPINLTRKKIPFDALEKYLNRLIENICMSEDDYLEMIIKEMKDYNEIVVEEEQLDLENTQVLNYVIDNTLLDLVYVIKKEGISPDPSERLIGKPQNTGDCPKASILGALQYHNYQINRNSNLYKKFLNDIKKQSLQEDGHLLDIALSSSLTNKKPSAAAKIKVDRAAAKLLLPS